MIRFSILKSTASSQLHVIGYSRSNESISIIVFHQACLSESKFI